MSTLTVSSASHPLLRLPSLPHAPFSSSMPSLPFPLPLRLLRRRLSSLSAAAVRPDSAAAVWTPAPLTLISPASSDASLFHLSVDLSDAPDLASGYTAPGQYLQVRVPSSAGEAKPAFLAIASPPPLAIGESRFEFLVKRVPGSTADLLCGMKDGDVIELGAVMGRGFEIEKISPPDAVNTVFIFATGSGISPIRALIESGFSANKRTDVRLYYGARNLQRMAYQERFKDWESTGVRIIPVFSRPDDSWKGEKGYIQTAFFRAKQILNPSSTGAVLCGHKQMTEDVTSVLVADGVSKDKILKNF
ncbi:fruit protein pKIWI502 [Typha angustifolia]|uniref:fruit protein pKIWI502 n=1 Tax=Typha angustifolia TaxID=59011 RepID=UPI003C2D0981